MKSSRTSKSKSVFSVIACLFTRISEIAGIKI
jgi:hypothetical protein